MSRHAITPRASHRVTVPVLRSSEVGVVLALSVDGVAATGGSGLVEAQRLHGRQKLNTEWPNFVVELALDHHARGPAAVWRTEDVHRC